MAALMALLAGTDNVRQRLGWRQLRLAAILVAVQQESWLEDVIRMDPVKFRVALPAAYPPDNPNVDQARSCHVTQALIARGFNNVKIGFLSP